MHAKFRPLCGTGSDRDRHRRGGWPAGAVGPGVATAGARRPERDQGEPAGNKVFLVGHAVGVQIYSCSSTPTGFGWTFVAPRADLFNDRGKLIMSHFGGPTWQARDGSRVVGKVAGTATVDRKAFRGCCCRRPRRLPGRTVTSSSPPPSSSGSPRRVGSPRLPRAATSGRSGLRPKSRTRPTTSSTRRMTAREPRAETRLRRDSDAGPSASRCRVGRGHGQADAPAGLRPTPSTSTAGIERRGRRARQPDQHEVPPRAARGAERQRRLRPRPEPRGRDRLGRHYLYVAETDGGLRVFDMRHLLKVPNPDDALGYAFVLPQVGLYKTEPGLRFSFVAPDRTTARADHRRVPEVHPGADRALAARTPTTACPAGKASGGVGRCPPATSRAG